MECRHTGVDLQSMLSRLNGIFFLVIWDSDQDALLLVRDALWCKNPLLLHSSRLPHFRERDQGLLPLVGGLGPL